MRKRSQSFSVKGGIPHLLRLDAEKMPPPPPSFFICPISLEVMQSPVSLCTGVTYDRSSIQRWLDAGNTTCPATMQPLVSTDLVPNLTLRRLIHHWSSSSSSSSSSTATAASFDDNLPPLSDITRFLSDPAANVADKLRLLSADSLRPSALASLLLSSSSPLHETLEHAVTLVSLLLSLDLVDGELKRVLTATLLSNIDATVSALTAVLKGSGVVRLPSRIAAARILEVVLSASSSDSEVRTLIAEKPYLMTELVRLIKECDEQAVDVGLQCLLGLINAESSVASPAASPASRRVMSEFVKAGAMAELTRLLEREVAASAVLMAMRAMEAAAGCAEGRAAICEEAERCVAAVVGRMMKIGNEGREAAVGVLWSVCYGGGGGGRDRRAREAMAAEKGGMAKILMVMQGDCSPAGRRMAGDLLKIFSADARTSIDAAGYDTKTIHIMPY